MTPRLFGHVGRQLFGVYHPPATRAVRDVGVVLCYPAPQEYRLTHWAFRKMALLLAKEGFHVLRFDYYATGDSAGDSDEGSLERWREDIGTAASELRDLAGIKKVSLVGMRLGASLAMQACAAGLKARDLVLWEPVVNGHSYLRELDQLENGLAQERAFPVDQIIPQDELLGFPFSSRMRADIAALNLMNGPWGPVERISLVVAQRRPQDFKLHERVKEAGHKAEYRYVSDPGANTQGGDAEATLLSHQTLAEIVGLLVRKPS